MSNPSFRCVYHNDDVYNQADITIHQVRTDGPCHIIRRDDEYEVIDLPIPDDATYEIADLRDGSIFVTW